MSTFYKIQANCRLFQYFSGAMQRNAAVLTIGCVLLCFTFNYTFPLHRETSDISFYANSTPQCSITVHRDNIVDRSKKMTSNLENALKRIKQSTQDIGKNIYDHVNVLLNSEQQKNTSALSEEDLRQYEQLVIMKKYPYLDINELELKYSPSNKNARQSVKFESGSSIENEPGFCEQPFEEGPNVEITNRGLSGFAIPPQISKLVNLVEIRSKINKMDSDDKLETVKLAKKSSEHNIISGLKDDVRAYVERKANKLK